MPLDFTDPSFHPKGKPDKPLRIVHYNANGPHYKNLGPQFDMHQVHIVDELRQAGHEVLSVDPAALLDRFDTPENYGDVTVEAVRRFHAAGGCDLFFSGATDDTLAPATVRAISDMGIPTTNLNFDDYSHPFRVRDLMPAFDVVWTTARENMGITRSYGVRKLVHMPFAANPHRFFPAPAPAGGPARELLFIGSCYGARFRSVCQLAQADIPVCVAGQSPFTIYGKDKPPNPLRMLLARPADGWERVKESLSFPAGRTILRAGLWRAIETRMRDVPEKNPNAGPVRYEQGPSFDDVPALYAASAMSLGSMELASTFVLKDPLQFIRVREFEAAMCGAVHLVNHFPELCEYFDPGSEMLTYDSPEEMVAMAAAYLDPKRDAERAAIGQAARIRAASEHSWRHRFQVLFDTLGVNVTA